MNRLPFLLSVAALALAVVAMVGAYRDRPMPAPGLDEATVTAMIEEKIAAAGAATGQTQAQAAQTPISPALDPDVIGPIVHEYMVAHPQILEDVLTALEAKREQDQVVAQTEALKNNREEIFHSPSSPVVGNPAGNVTLVEFFDYNCGYCKRMLPAMVDLMKTDPNLRVVFKEWPVLTEGSGEAARISLAVLKVAPERYLDFHVQLMSEPGGDEGINQKRALDVAEKLGIDRNAVIAAAKDPSIDDAITENFKVAEALGLRGTPSYVVGDEIVPGAISFEELQQKIAKARETDCQTC